MRLWAGQTVSEVGSSITGLGIPLTALLVLEATPAQMGLLAAVATAPGIVFGLLAGVWVDRLRRRPIMIACDLGRALLLGSIPAAALLGWLRVEHLLAVAVLSGILTVLFQVAYRSYLPSLVERENIVEANSRLSLSDSLVEIVGDGLAGVLVQALSAPIAMLLDALSFLFSAAAVTSIRSREPVPQPAAGRQSVFRELAEGLSAVLDEPILRALAISSGLLNFFGNFIGALYALYTVRELGLGPALVGMIIAVGGVSALAGSLFAATLVRRFGLGTAFIGGLAVMSATAMLIPLAGGPPASAAAILVASQLLGDAAWAVYFINEVSLRQAVTPDRLLGRATATTQLIVTGAAALGAVAGGVLGEALGVRPTLFLGALGPLLACLWLLATPVRVLRVQPVQSPIATGDSPRAL